MTDEARKLYDQMMHNHYPYAADIRALPMPVVVEAMSACHEAKKSADTALTYLLSVLANPGRDVKVITPTPEVAPFAVIPAVPPSGHAPAPPALHGRPDAPPVAG